MMREASRHLGNALRRVSIHRRLWKKVKPEAFVKSMAELHNVGQAAGL
jgi:hypothetical protein